MLRCSTFCGMETSIEQVDKMEIAAVQHAGEIMDVENGKRGVVARRRAEPVWIESDYLVVNISAA